MTDNRQALAALELANRRRMAVARAKRELKSGRRSLEDVLRDPQCGCASVVSILSAQHRWGKKRSAQLMAHFGVGYARRVEDLTDRQVAAISRAAQMAPGQWWEIQRAVAA